MKKLSLVLISALLVASSCKKDDDLAGVITPPNDPLASLTVKKYKRPMLFVQSAVNCADCPTAQAVMGLANHFFKDTVVTLAVHSGSDPLSSNLVAADLLTNFASAGPAPEYYVGNTPASDEAEAYAAIQIDKQSVPIAGVTHQVTELADKFIVDAKVEFLTGGKTFDFYVSTYAVERNILATGGLQQMGTSLVTPNTAGTTSTWASDTGPINATDFLYNQGDNYYHDYILRAGPDTTGTWGLALAGINPTLDDYFPGDILGTSNTPIRFEITKDPTWDSNNIVFLTVFWDFDPGAGVYEYVNAYMNGNN